MIQNYQYKPDSVKPRSGGALSEWHDGKRRSEGMRPYLLFLGSTKPFRGVWGALQRMWRHDRGHFRTMHRRRECLRIS